MSWRCQSGPSAGDVLSSSLTEITVRAMASRALSGRDTEHRVCRTPAHESGRQHDETDHGQHDSKSPGCYQAAPNRREQQDAAHHPHAPIPCALVCKVHGCPPVQRLNATRSNVTVRKSIVNSFSAGYAHALASVPAGSVATSTSVSK